MIKLLIGFVLGFSIATYGVKNTIEKAEELTESGKNAIKHYSDSQ
jgi:hypothetical protein